MYNKNTLYHPTFLFQYLLIKSYFVAGKYHEQINIDDNATGYSYENIFTRFVKNDVFELVEIDDPYIKSRHQVFEIIYHVFENI